MTGYRGRAIRNTMITLIVAGMAGAFPAPAQKQSDPAGEKLYAFSLYGGRMTSNHIDDFIDSAEDIDFEKSWLTVAALSRRIANYKDLISFEIEGQLARHFRLQDHWEFNSLIAARWEPFWWDQTLDTSFAVGVGPSYATDKPEIEIDNNDETARLLVYMMFEFEFALPDRPGPSLILRIHHRSNAFGLIHEDGGSNAFTAGLKYRF